MEFLVFPDVLCEALVLLLGRISLEKVMFMITEWSLDALESCGDFFRCLHQLTDPHRLFETTT